jgi:hypothetical protein
MQELEELHSKKDGVETKTLQFRCFRFLLFKIQTESMFLATRQEKICLKSQ